MSDKLYETVFKIVPRHCSRPALLGVLHDKGNVVASDSYSAAIVKSPYSKLMEEVILGRQGVEIKEKPWDYQSIVPKIERCRKSDKQFSVEDTVRACELMPKSADPAEDSQTPPVLLDLNGYTFFAPRLLKILNVFRVLGEEPMQYQEFQNDGRLLLKSEKCTGVIVPVYRIISDCEKYTITEMLEIGDLL